MGKAAKTTMIEMVEHAVKSGKGEKLSRRKIKTYLETEYGLKVDSDSVKTKINDAINEEVTKGILDKEKDSFKFSPKGKKHYEKVYGQVVSDEEEGTDEEAEEEDTPSKKTKAKKVVAAEEGDE
ncbi:hypothetical protein JCM8208_006094 [Rhodotorula glutinis]